MCAAIVFAASSTVSSRARAATYEIHPGDDLWGRLASLTAGDEVIVHAGTYPQTSRWEATWAGTAEAPIVVRAAEGEARPVLTRGAGQNLMNLHGSYFTFRGFELTGGSHGIRMSAVEHATLEDLLIHDTGDVAISCNITGMDCAFVTIRDTEIHSTSGTGEGLYLGCNNGACAFRDGLIERNYIHDTRGSQGDGIEIKGGSWGNVIRDNVVVRSGPAVGIIVYGFDAMAGRERNVIERNLVWDANQGIQATSHAIVRNNVVIGSADSGIRSQANQGTPGHLEIVNNTVVGGADACLRGNDWSGREAIVVANNALYCSGGTAIRASGGTFAGNVVLGAVVGTTSGFTMGAGLDADLGPMAAAAARVYPPAGSALIDAADAAYAPADDFDLRARGASPDVGAYERGPEGAQFWIPAEDFKAIDPRGPMPDGGMPDGGTAGTDGGTASGDAGAGGIDGGVGSGDAGAEPAPDGGGPDADGGSGCGCRVGGGGSPTSAVALGVAIVIALVRRRRCRG